MAELMSNGVELMLVGMGIVYLFLTMLVVAINFMSKVVQRFFPEPPLNLVVPPAGKSSGGIDGATAAAITAAVHNYKQNND